MGQGVFSQPQSKAVLKLRGALADGGARDAHDFSHCSEPSKWASAGREGAGEARTGEPWDCCWSKQRHTSHFLSLTGPGVWGQAPELPCRGFFCRLPPSACCEVERAVTTRIKGLQGKGGGFPAGLPREISLPMGSGCPCPRASPGAQALPGGSLLRERWHLARGLLGLLLTVPHAEPSGLHIRPGELLLLLGEGLDFCKTLPFLPSPLARCTLCKPPWSVGSCRAGSRLGWAWAPRGFPTVSMKWEHCFLPLGLRSSV